MSKQKYSTYSKVVKQKAKGIKAFVMDVDGVLSDGRIHYDSSGNEWKSFHVKDGYIIHHLKNNGILTGIISGRNSAVVTKRVDELHLDFCYQGIDDKLQQLKKIITDQRNIKLKEVAYIGDDLNDLNILLSCGLSAAPADAHSYIKRKVDYVTKAKGGHGAVRELADLILDAQGKYSKLQKK